MTEPASPDGSSERRDRAERLYEEARSLPAGERAKFIADACGDDDALRDELEGLLSHADAAEDFFDNLARVVPMKAVVADRYEIVECIGTGGMGAVYRSWDRRLHRDVALKFLPSELAATPDAEEAMLREARAAASLEHPNICTVHEVATDGDGRPFISMAYYEGETLKERLRRAPMPLDEVVATALQLARGLAAAHARGIVHRDVKPSNVMLVRDGPVKLLDFGIARLSDATVTRPGVTPGTLAYMSPEQARGDPVGPAGDLFTLGIVLYEMAAGVHPFRRENPHAVVHAILHDEPPPLRQRNPAAPAALEQIVVRLLRNDHAARYPSAGAVAAELERLSSQPAGSAPRWIARVQSVRPRHLVAAALLATAAVAAAVTLGSRGPAATANTSPGTIAAQPVSGTWPAGAKTIAVLPFTNLSPDAEESYLVDGLTEELIGVLSQVRDLRVVARTSAFAYKGTNRDIREIGEALQVGAILEGSVQRVGDRIRVRAQLINVADGLHLWSEAYDHEATDIFTIQRDLALRIAGALEAELSPAERERVTARHTTSPEAFALYLKGRHFWNQRTSSAFVRAAEYYSRAIEADSQFASAYAGLATAYSLQGLWGDLPSAVAGERMRAAATQAVLLDERLAEAHAALGVYLHVYAWDSEAAEREQLRALELDPRLGIAHYFYGNLLRVHGRLDEALAHYRTAAELDPLDPLVGEAIGRTLVLGGRLDEAREYMVGALELDSLFWWPHAGLGALHEARGELDESLEEYRRAMELGGSKIDVARLLARTGEAAEARRMLGELQAQAARTGIHPPEIATILYWLGDADSAMAWLELAFTERHPLLRFMPSHPEFVPLEADPRYVDLLRRIGLRG